MLRHIQNDHDIDSTWFVDSIEFRMVLHVIRTKIWTRPVVRLRSITTDTCDCYNNRMDFYIVWIEQMITIQILERNDEILPTDWCRPLSLRTMSGGHSDYFSFESCYNGQPENNVKWVNVHQIFGEVWYNKKLSELNDTLRKYGGSGYEFVRGEIPVSHQYGITARDASIAYELYLGNTISTHPKHNGKTWAHIKRIDSAYFEWADDRRVIKRKEDFK